ncbi:MAG: hypothetical protein ACP5NZ_03890 [Nanobdellota archaeon]
MSFWETILHGDVGTIIFPFLLIFALIFGLLMKINIFGTKDDPKKNINAIIAAVVALIALQFNTVSSFFSDLFPRLGVALAIILTILILFAFVVDFENKYTKNILIAIVIISLIAIFWVPFSNMGFKISLGDFFEKNLGWIFFILLIVGLIIWTVVGSGKNNNPKGPFPEGGGDGNPYKK